MKRVKTGDIVVIVLILALCAGVLCFRLFGVKSGESVCVSVGEKSYFYSLSEDKKIEFENNGVELTVVIENGCAYIEKSDCPSNDCVRTGKISKKGSIIICAPSRIYVKITGEGDADYDYLVG
jgi:hypothetical protein